MARLIATAILILMLSLAHADTDVANRACPKLPSDSSLSWQYRDGPDFYVCNARLKGSSQKLVGVYVGFHPDFHPNAENFEQSGNVGGYSIQWYRKRLETEQFRIALEARFPLLSARENPPVAQVHIWVLANDKASLSSLLQQLEKTSFAHIKF